MKPNQTILALTAAAALAAGGLGCRHEPPPTPTAAIGPKTWTLELAMTDAQRYQGLSDRTSLPPGAGMLFVFPQARELFFCMRRMHFDLDIAFIGPDMRVVRVHRMKVEPFGRSEQTYSSMAPAQYALEVNAGELQQAGVKEGDRVAFASVPDPAKADPAP